MLQIDSIQNSLPRFGPAFIELEDGIPVETDDAGTSWATAWVRMSTPDVAARRVPPGPRRPSGSQKARRSLSLIRRSSWSKGYLASRHGRDPRCSGVHRRKKGDDAARPKYRR